MAANASPPVMVDELVFRDRVQPRGERQRAIVALAPFVDRNQRFLHQILQVGRVDAKAARIIPAQSCGSRNE